MKVFKNIKKGDSILSFNLQTYEIAYLIVKDAREIGNPQMLDFEVMDSKNRPFTIQGLKNGHSARNPIMMIYAPCEKGLLHELDKIADTHKNTFGLLQEAIKNIESKLSTE